ncbi:MAG: DUF445 family protein [Acidobacteriota bacterium]|nr:DUF445 family protein [Acidobacteriota bacterium]MDH3528552.1 DUF445 family protein [Acidobacteriota bacterium]
MEQVYEFFGQVWVQLTGMVIFAAVHGYAAAWLAVRMLFRPRRPIKVLGITIFPQGMIPRHRERLANAIGKAVGQELVSQETVLEHLFEREFLQTKIQGVVNSYTEELLTQDYPSIVEALPENLRGAVLESVDALQEKLGIYVERVIQSEVTREEIRGFIDRRVDEFLGQTVSEVFTEENYNSILEFVENKTGSIVNEPKLEEQLAVFIGNRVEDLAHTETPLGEMFTPEAIALLKEKAVEQIEPIIHQLADLATEDRTKNQISALIKKEVHSYYEQLPFFKKIFVSRDNLLREVDDLVDESLPKRIEETLQGDFFAEEAAAFVSKTIDNTLARPLPDLIGTIEQQHLDHLKRQLTKSILSVLRSPEMQQSISAFLADSLAKLRPQKVGEILRSLHLNAADEIKKTLANGLENVLNNADTTKIIHSVLSAQIDSLLHAPIGRLNQHISEDKIRNAGNAMTETIIATARVKLPEAIQEFDIGGVVRDKVNGYPEEKLESLVMTIAREHLRTIEFFGFLFGLFVGLAQAAYVYWTILFKIAE